MKSRLTGLVVFLTFVFSFLSAGTLFATVDQSKLYQKTFGGEKPKCSGCHVDKLPKKEAGKHDPNEYGKKVIAAKAAEAPTEETYKAVGPIPAE